MRQQRPAAVDQDPLLVVALGASAGGLAALQQFFRSLPTDCQDLAFVVLQHLSVDHKGVMQDILERATTMPVRVVESGERLVGHTTFLMPPGCYLSLKDGCLMATPRLEPPHLPIDHFLQSLAEEVEDRAVAMILSGTGSDGSIGLLAIKEAGGLVMAQDESSAEYGLMPRSAIDTGAVDFVLTPSEMAMELSHFLRHRSLVDPHEGLSEAGRLFETLLEKTGVDFSDYKKEILLRRVRRRMAVRQLSSLPDYLELLQRDAQEVKILKRDILIGVTRFFRDPDSFLELEQKVITPLLEACPDRPLRIWVAGCSTGEEVYSLIILFLERAAALGQKLALRVFATDLSSEALRVAGLGQYCENIAADVSAERLDRYFVAREGGYQVCPAVREKVVFSLHNLVQDPPFTGLDIILCRNLLIYFETNLKRRVLSYFHYALQPGGFLFLGASESTGELQESFTVCDLKSRIYQKLGLSSNLYRWPARPGAGCPQGRVDPAKQLARAVEQGYRWLLEENCPPSLLVDQAGQVMHVFVNADSYLKFPSGSVRLGLTDLLSTKLASVAASALFRAFREDPPCDHLYPEILIQEDDNVQALRALPLPSPHGRSEFAVVTLRTVSGPPDALGTLFVSAPALSADSAEQILYLRRELQELRTNYQTTVEELESSNEELQANNEELQSTGQEYQSSTEQMRGQLKQASEELLALTSDYNLRVAELTGDLNQMVQFLSCLQPAVLFLDDQLQILYATEGVNHYIPIVGKDAGRPIVHFTTNFSYPRFLSDANRVVLDGLSFEQELKTKSQREDFSLRLAPYQAGDQKRGVMVTFVPSSVLK